MARVTLLRQALFALGLALAAATPSQAALRGASAALVSFSASATGGLEFEGKTSELSVAESSGKIHFVVPLANVDTGISLRNKHMREKYLEVGKYPNAELVVDRSALNVPPDGQTSTGSVVGSMTIHGQTRPVTVRYSARRAGASFAISGQVPLDVRDFGIRIPSYLGVTVKPNVEVTLVRATVVDS